MKCTSCGNEMREDAAFCTFCGVKAESAPSVPAPKAPEPKEDLESLFGRIRELVKKENMGLQKKLAEKEEKIHMQELQIKELQDKLDKLQQSAVVLTEQNVCPGCGNTITNDMVFCNRCGAKVRQ